MVLVDFPLSATADTRWRSSFAARVASSAVDAWTVTGTSIRLRSRSSPEALRVDIAALRQVVAYTNQDCTGATQDEPLMRLQRVIDDEFDRHT
jgi:hypothetical protein